tara:strand:+ start:1766 stop:2266 length:501 start_codon:yes stop_codon:yes gene_type:complete
MADVQQKHQKAKYYEEDVVQLIRSTHKRWAIAEPADKYAKVDGLSYNVLNHQLEAVYEIKCRNAGFKDLMTKYDGELIIDTQKLEGLQSVSSVLCIPSYVFTYMLHDGFVLKTKITNDKGEYVCNKKDAVQQSSAGIGKGVKDKMMSKVKLDGTEILSTTQPVGSI